MHTYKTNSFISPGARVKLWLVVAAKKLSGELKKARKE